MRWLYKMTGLSSVYDPVAVNSKCGVPSKRNCESHESCVCTGFSACGCQKKSVVYEMECRHVAQRGKHSIETHTSNFIFNTEIGSQWSFSRRGIEWWW